MTADRLIAGRYRLSDPIGSGAMGVVWRGTDVRLQRTVAVKQLLLAPHLTGSQALEAKLRAMREGRIAARLHHPNAITVFDVAEEDGQPWLVMEFMDAPSLAARLAGKRTLPPVEVARVGAQAAAALAAAHTAGIMHRDVKPANLLVADDGTVKITDFGISRAVGDVTVTATGFLAGTPAYLAPEVARGENPEPSSDVFALGSTLYAAVEGAPPFGEGDNPLAVLHAVARGEIPPPRQAGALAPVLMRLLTGTVEARLTMQEAREALEAVAAGRAPALAAAPVVTKVLPSPGAVAGATTVLPSSATGSGPSNAADPTAYLGAATGPPFAPVHSGGGPRGGGSGPVRQPAVSPTPIAPIPPAQARTSRGGPDRRLLAVAAAALVGLVVVVVLAVAVQTRGGDDNTAAPPATTNPPVEVPGGGSIMESPKQAPVAPPPTTSAPTTTPPASTTPPPPPPEGPPTPERIAGFIQSYYGMLPGNIGGAWAQLSPSYQAQTGGYGAFSSFWSSIRSVRVNGVTPNGADAATASLTYVKSDGSTATENRWLRVSSEGGRLVISASSA
ncbi:serine/threonine-protein kinase [Nocardia bovistercoris]|uniref:non-specific serine/threonine protein kinase n=1 Tax=Nocardia bovistercoris TaxID=2785916 RepID=A0A931N190_9NOCA|nr:serine/threonine-protein kinase [Nocardia bovistercoris]MBH0774681.1 serine/threonine protein kinase [Nocardia bovistercoris]